MSTAAEIQALLRFLTQDAKVPLPTAMSKVKELQKANLASLITLAKSDVPGILAIFPDEKIAKQILNAAKRINKKRSSSDATEAQPKRKRTIAADAAMTPAAIEEALALPEVTISDEKLVQTVLHTNRAPLVLAFAVTLLKYTMPEQPLSSRLSLAQAVVSVNSRSKAISLGIEKGNSAEEEGWGQGQPKVRIMGRDIRVLKRWGYDWREGARTRHEDGAESQNTIKGREAAKQEDIADSQDTIKADQSQIVNTETAHKEPGQSESEPALWGLDLEALRSSNGPLSAGAQCRHTSGLPIYTAQSARSYLLKSFATAPPQAAGSENSPRKKQSAASAAAEKERNLGLLLHSLDLLYSSWARALGKDELDRRAWSWYVRVRPEVQNGVAGWGGRGEVPISEILGLRRKG
ncbi:Impact family [Lasallia pustulata]|uniref:Impact family n=1 Tax=Lasallia pustulata TaxID=136370 RepID=A0A1W5CVL6_9LECA|nr:Impact family [Lasallia pustulata]